MADNVAITAGSGTTMAADEVADGTLGTVKVAYGKIMDGTLDGTNKLTITSGNAAKVDGSAVTQPVSGTVTANLGTIAGVSTAAKQPALGTAGTASADVLTVQGIASMTALKTDGSGVTQPVSGTVSAAQSGTWTVQPGNTANTTAWKVDGSAVTQPVSLTSTTVTGTVAVTESGTWNVGSSSATGSAVPANGFYSSGQAKTSLPAAASDGNLTGAMFDKFGRQVVLIDGIRDISATQTTTITASTAETTIGTAVASTFLDLTSVLISNTSASATRVDFRDTTGGSVIFSLYVPAGDTRGFVVHTPIPQTTVNTNWTAQSSASVTDLRVFIKFIKNK